MFGEVRIALETVELIFSEQIFQTCTDSLQQKYSDHVKDTSKLQQKFKVNITPHQIRVTCSSDSSKRIYLFPSNLQPIPSSHSNVEWISGDGLHLRFKVSRPDLLPHFESEEAEIPPDLGKVCLTCKSCGQEITRTIQTVSPLPSDDWESVVEELWCCRSKDLAGCPPDLLVSPEENGCLTGNFDYIISVPQLLENATVIRNTNSGGSSKKSSKQRRLVACSRCRNIIGKTLKEAESRMGTLSLWKFQTAFSQNAKISTSLEYLVATYIRKQSKNQPTFKFMVENEDHEAQLLLWLVSSDSLLLTTDPEDAIEMEGGASSAIANVRCVSIMKLLYQICWDEAGIKMKDEWSRDMMVHSFILPTTACHQLVEILVESTRRTPQSMRKMKGLLIGYLKTS